MSEITQEQFSAGVSQLLTLGTHINDLFVQQYQRIGFHNDESGNDYRAQEARLSKLMMDKGLTNEQHKQHADAILKVNDRYKAGFVANLVSLGEQIKTELLQFEELFNSVSPYSAVQPSMEEVRTWLTLSAELYVARTMATRSVEIRVEVDRFIPTNILNHDGQTELMLTADEGSEFARSLAEAGELLKGAHEHEEDERIEPLRTFVQEVLHA